MNFTVMNNSINFSNEFIELNKLRGKFLELAIESVEDFTEKYSKRFNNMEALSEEGEVFGCEFLDEYLSKGIDVIKEFEMNSIDAETFKEKYYYGRYCTWFAEFDKVNEKYLLSINDSMDIEVFRNQVNEKRSNWYSDNSDVNKEAEANIKVGSLKRDSKLVRNKVSVEMKDIITSNNENSEENIDSQEVLNILANSMLESIFNIHFSIIDVLKDNGVETVGKYSDFSEVDKANELLETLTKQEMSKENNEDTEKIKEVIELNPYNEEVYEVLLEKYGDKDNEIENIGKFLGYLNMGEYKCTKLDEYYKDLPLETNEQIRDAKEKVISFANNLHIQEYEKYIQELDSKLLNEKSNETVIPAAIPTEENVKETSEDISENKELEAKNIEEKVEEETKESSSDEFKNETEVKSEEINPKTEIETNAKNNKEKKIKICAIAALVCIVVLYLGTSLYFKDRFYFGTTIDNMNVTGKTVNEVYEEVSSNAADYKVELNLRGGSTSEIKGTDIGLEYDFQDEIQRLKDNQNPLGWVSGVFSNDEYNLSDGISYNNDLLNDSINKLPCFDEKTVVEPKNPELKYEKTSYELIKEVEGNKVNKEKLTEKIIASIKNKETNLNIEETGCYEEPKYTSESEEVVKAKEELNKYVKSTINYNVSGNKQVINGDLTHTWFSVDDDFTVKFNEDEVKKYVDGLGNKYDKTGNIRQFNGIKFSTSTEIVTMDRPAEVSALIELVKNGENAEREAKFNTNAVGNGIVNTFVEVDITKQHIWFYKNGKLIADGPTVTGNISQGHNTRVGVFKLYGKQRNTVLKGEDYAVPVDFWMPFDGGIGIHDASWRGQFGGDIYKTNGSHGCVNTLYPVAQSIYNNINVGDYVICHY